MKFATKTLVALSLVFILPCGFAGAQESAKKKFHALVVTGGHAVDEKSFHAMLDSIPNITWNEVRHPDANSWLAPEKAVEYDFIFLYDAWDKITEEEKGNFTRLIENGKPVLGLHHCLLSYNKWPEFSRIIGGRYIYLGEQEIEGKKYGYSTVKDKAEITCEPLAPDHPILKGIEKFTVTDELYANMYIFPGVNVLLETKHPGMESPIAWTNHYGAGKIFTFQLGHGKNSFEDENFKRIMRQAVDWLNRPEKLRKNPPHEMMKQGWGRPNFVMYRNLDDDPAEECIGLFFRDRSYHAFYEITTAYWAILDGRTNEVKYTQPLSRKNSNAIMQTDDGRLSLSISRTENSNSTNSNV